MTRLFLVTCPLVVGCLAPPLPAPAATAKAPAEQTGPTSDAGAASAIDSPPTATSRLGDLSPSEVDEYLRAHGTCKGKSLTAEVTDGGKSKHAGVHTGASRDGGAPPYGSLPPEVIQRIVREQYVKFRACYEAGLSRDPNLHGRVSVRFMIGRDGRVSNVDNAGSDLPDADAVACVVREYSALCFPPPEGGIVTVVYPIMFSPGD